MCHEFERWTWTAFYYLWGIYGSDTLNSFSKIQVWWHRAVPKLGDPGSGSGPLCHWPGRPDLVELGGLRVHWLTSFCLQCCEKSGWCVVEIGLRAFGLSRRRAGEETLRREFIVECILKARRRAGWEWDGEQPASCGQRGAAGAFLLRVLWRTDQISPLLLCSGKASFPESHVSPRLLHSFN